MGLVTGRIVATRTQEPLDGWRVEAWPGQPAALTMLGSAVSDRAGSFQIEIDDVEVRTLVVRRVDVELRVFDRAGAAVDAPDLARWDPRNPGRSVLLAIPIDDGIARQVGGLVVDEHGVARAGLRVEAWDRDLIDDRRLAVDRTDAAGRYRLTYGAGPGGSVDLQIRIRDPRANNNEVGRSRTLFAAPDKASIDVVVRSAELAPRPEYERLLAAARPTLRDRPLGSLPANAVGYLAERIGWDPRAVAMAAQAEQLSAATAIPAVAATAIPAEHAYALLRVGLPGDPDALVHVTDAALERSLTAAVEADVITDAEPIGGTVARLRARALDRLRALTPPGAVSSLGDMLALRLDSGEQKQFVAVFRDTARAAADNPDALWDGLRGAGFAERTIIGLQLDAALGQLTRHNAPLIERLRTQHEVTSPEDLARKGFYDAERWQAVIGEITPAGVTKENYAKGLAAQVRLQFPVVVVARLVRGSRVHVDAREEVADFLDAAGSNRIGTDPVRTWAGFDRLRPKVQAGLLRVERLYQISPSHESLIALSGLGTGSAAEVARIPEATFVAQHGSFFPSPAEARRVHRKATDVHAAVLHLAATYLTYRGAPNIYGLTGDPTGSRTLIQAPGGPVSATLERLFTAQDYTACDHCQSVLGPAAYLVDLFEFLDPVGVTHLREIPPAKVLFERRPDLKHIQLSCENSHVELPYVDIVNEILEHWVVDGSLGRFTGRDTGPDVTSADLLADPHFVREAAYSATASAVHPYLLPFDLPRATLRRLLLAWDISLPQALEAFGDLAGARREHLELNAAAYQALTDNGFRPLPLYFGRPGRDTIDQLNYALAAARFMARALGVDYEELVALVSSRLVSPPGMPPVQLVGDPGASFADLEVRRVHPDGTIEPLDELTLHKLHRMVRFARSRGWSIEHTDRMLTTFLGAAPENRRLARLDAAFTRALASVANLERLFTRLEVTPGRRDAWLSLWLDPQTARYERLAQLLRAGTAELRDLSDLAGIDPFARDLHEDEPSLLRFVELWMQLGMASVKVSDLDYLLRHRDESGKRTSNTAELRSIVRSLRSALAAVDAELDAAARAPDLAMAQSTMATVFDAAVVARFFGLLEGTTRYATTEFEIRVDALPAALTDAGLDFDRITRQPGFSGVMSEAQYIRLRKVVAALTLDDVDPGVIADPAALAELTGQLGAAVDSLREQGQRNLAAFGSEFPGLLPVLSAARDAAPTARPRIVLDGLLPELRAARRAAAVRTALATAVEADPAIVDALLGATAVAGPVSTPALDVLGEILALGQPVRLGVGTHPLLLDPPESGDFLLWVAAPQSAHIALTVDGVHLAVDGVQLLATTPVHTSQLLRTRDPVRFAAGELIELVVDVTGPNGDLSADLAWSTPTSARAPVPADRIYRTAEVDTAAACVVRVTKAAALAGLLALTPAEVAHLGTATPETRGVFAELPADAMIAEPVVHWQVERIRWLAWFAQLKKEREPEPDTLVGLLRDPSVVTAQQRLAEIMGRPSADLEAVLRHHGIEPAEVGGLAALATATRSLALVGRANQPAADLIEWVTPTPDAALVGRIKDALRARLGEDGWRETMTTVNDTLRNQRRDALVAHILSARPPKDTITTADQLYEHFLVDVQMDACARTSRIRLALSSVQLFITRCLMNLEERVAPESIDAAQWAWMQRYRLWEANRKVFLYPENWLDPELRDDKSPFFRELKSELLKSDLTNELAEQAYLDYLKKLDDVAKLEIIGAYLDERRPGDPADDVLHVIGRTNGTSRQHYARRYEGGYWTPWERVPLPIEGDIVLPVVWKQQLFLFWLSVLTKPTEIARSKSPDDTAKEKLKQNARIDVEISLCWGEYYRGKWTSPKSSETSDPIRLPGLRMFAPSELVVQTRTEGRGPRLVFTVLYPPALMRGTVVLTSKHRPPQVASEQVEPRLFVAQGSSPIDAFIVGGGARRDANSVLAARTLRVATRQPSGAQRSTIEELILTKTTQLLPGLRVRPLMHPIENFQESPFFYSDERSIFHVEVSATTTSRPRGYFETDLVLDADEPLIHELIESPVSSDVPTDGEVEVPPISVRLAGSQSFTFDGVTFDAPDRVDGRRGGER